MEKIIKLKKLILILILVISGHSEARDSEYQKALDRKLEAHKSYYLELKKLNQPTETQKKKLREKTIGEAEKAYQKAEKKWIQNQLKEFQIDLVEGSPGFVKEVNVDQLAKEADSSDESETEKKILKKRKPSQSQGPIYESGSRVEIQKQDDSKQKSPELDGSNVPKYMEFPGQ